MVDGAGAANFAIDVTPSAAVRAQQPYTRTPLADAQRRRSTSSAAASISSGVNRTRRKGRESTERPDLTPLGRA